MAQNRNLPPPPYPGSPSRSAGTPPPVQAQRRSPSSGQPSSGSGRVSPVPGRRVSGGYGQARPQSGGNSGGHPVSGHAGCAVSADEGFFVMNGRRYPRVWQQGPYVYMNMQYPTIGSEVFVYDTRKSPLGAGGMGTVYMGWSQKDNRPVAIKMVNPQFAANPVVRERAREEALQAFSHNNLIEMLGYVVSPVANGPMYIISNYVNGVTLDRHVERLRGFPDSTQRIVRTFYPVLEALKYLHQRRLLHLDIKPSNIMVESGQSNVRLMDLGIAFTPGGAASRSSGLLGTPGYAAPEQTVVAGQVPDFDDTTDLYELGATLYQMLSGELPNPDEYVPIVGIPKALNNVLQRTLSADKSRRYQSAEDLQAALESALMPAQKPFPWLVTGIVAAAVLVVALITAMVVFLAN